MYSLSETSLEWALKHLERFPDSDFYPRLFEFECIRHRWTQVKDELLKLDMELYAPKAPQVCLAPKAKGGYRVVHQLDPIDSILYTALVYECCQKIEDARVPKSQKVACSYRIELDLNGSFFSRERDRSFIEKNNDLASRYQNGYVLICDITDFYNQIYLHRVKNILDEIGCKASKAIEVFLKSLNNNISRGIPVGPAASIIIAEVIMSDIDNRILRDGIKFTRYVDDINIYFDEYEVANVFLHRLTEYLYTIHRLVLSSDKTKIVTCESFLKTILDDEEKHEKQAIHERIEEMNNDYPGPSEYLEFEDLPNDNKYVIRGEAYLSYLNKSLEYDKINIGLFRHILRSAAKYKVRTLVPLLLDNFYRITPVINDVVIYLHKVINIKTVTQNKERFQSLLNSIYLELPFINIWVSSLFQHPAFNEIVFMPYNKVLRIRDKALIAKARKDLTWVKEIRGQTDVIPAVDKRAVIYSGLILSIDELNHWLKLESIKGDMLINSVCSFTQSKAKSQIFYSHIS